MTDRHHPILATLAIVHAVAFVVAGLVLFGLAVNPPTQRAGLHFLAWLLVFGGATLFAEHALLNAAAGVRDGADVGFLLSRDGRRMLKHDPASLFDAPALEAFERARTRLRLTAGVALVVLTGLAAANLVTSVREALAAP